MLIEIAKTIIAKIINAGLHVLFILPSKKNRIVFIPSNEHYYCNLKYIDQFLRKEKADVEIIWGRKQAGDASYPGEVECLSRYSLSFLRYFCTASVVLFNDGLPSWLEKREGQVWINTWHGGGAYKKIDAAFLKNPNKWQKLRAYHTFNKIDDVVSSCSRFTDSFKKDTGIHPDFLSIGMPRNDIFFDESRMNQAAQAVRARYKVSKDIGIVMYAPTFRDNGIKLDLDVNELLQSLEKRFHKKFILFVRSHPHVAKDIFEGAENQKDVIDVSEYVDMQELLCAADVLITDYSSSMWDYSLTGRPCFIYANDLVQYKKERNFHTPITDWPFPMAERNTELQQLILRFDEKKYSRDLERHHRELGSYESGSASAQICRLIEDICHGENTEKET